jgi:hypothetical protein
LLQTNGSKRQCWKRDWYEHIVGMKDSPLPHAVLQYKPSGQLNVGRRETTWTDDFSWERKRPKGLIPEDDDDG